MFEVRSDVATELDAKRAIDQGHVRRKASAEDGRVRNVVLTTKGANRLKKSRPLLSPWLNQHFTDVFNDQELKTLNKAMTSNV